MRSPRFAGGIRKGHVDFIGQSESDALRRVLAQPVRESIVSVQFSEMMSFRTVASTALVGTTLTLVPIRYITTPLTVTKAVMATEAPSIPLAPGTYPYVQSALFVKAPNASSVARRVPNTTVTFDGYIENYRQEIVFAPVVLPAEHVVYIAWWTYGGANTTPIYCVEADIASAVLPRRSPAAVTAMPDTITLSQYNPITTTRVQPKIAYYGALLEVV